MSNSYKIGLAGCGKMGTAMVRGWLAARLVSQIDILDPHGLPPELALEEKITYCKNEDMFIAASGAWDLLVVAVKPQTMEEFCATISKAIPSNLPVLSIAAGQTIVSFQNRLGAGRPIIRSMPNTPAAIGKGITVACATPNTDERVKDAASALLGAMGHIEWTNDESLLDAVTAVSGSGPAYLFYLIEALAEAGVKSGLDKDLSMTLARQTVIGSAALADHDADISASTLRENVTSPNGTTAAALSVLMDGRFQDLMTEAVAKATARSKELSK
jgi:pyrroline-5-carboxylate reductase